MKQFTPVEKIEILKKMIKHIKMVGIFNSYICHAFEFATGISYYQAFSYIPEIEKNKPKLKASPSVWFFMDEEGRQKRIEILEKTIKDIKEANNV